MNVKGVFGANAWRGGREGGGFDARDDATDDLLHTGGGRVGPGDDAGEGARKGGGVESLGVGDWEEEGVYSAERLQVMIVYGANAGTRMDGHRGRWCRRRRHRRRW